MLHQRRCHCNGELDDAHLGQHVPCLLGEWQHHSQTGANSKLVVNGTETNPVTFTSTKDDTICAIGAANEPICDSNNDGSATAPGTNDWGFIMFVSTVAGCKAAQSA